MCPGPSAGEVARSFDAGASLAPRRHVERATACIAACREERPDDETGERGSSCRDGRSRVASRCPVGRRAGVRGGVDQAGEP